MNCNTCPYSNCQTRLAANPLSIVGRDKLVALYCPLKGTIQETDRRLERSRNQYVKKLKEEEGWPA